MKAGFELTDTTKGVSEVTLFYRTKVSPKNRAIITSSLDAYQTLYNSWNKDLIEYIEEFKILLLNRSNRVLGIASLSKCIFRTKLVLRQFWWCQPVFE